MTCIDNAHVIRAAHGTIRTANDPASGVVRHADAGYDTAIKCARENGLKLPSLS